MAKILRQPVWVNVRLPNSSPVSAEGLFCLQKCTALKVGSWSFDWVIILLCTSFPLLNRINKFSKTACQSHLFFNSLTFPDFPSRF